MTGASGGASEAASQAKLPRSLLAILSLLSRFALGVLFVGAGLQKMRDPGGLAQEITNYQLWPALAPHLAIVLPGAEIVAGIALLVGPRPWRAAGAAAIGVLLLLFTGAVVSALARGLSIDCACFGGGSGAVTWITFGRNLGLLALAGAAFWGERGPLSPTPEESPRKAGENRSVVNSDVIRGE